MVIGLECIEVDGLAAGRITGGQSDDDVATAEN